MKYQKINKLVLFRFIRIWDQRFKFESLVNVFSILITTICTFSVIIILSVNDGFKKNIVNILTDLNGDKRIYPDEYLSLSEFDYQQITSIYKDQFKISRFHTKKCIVKTSQNSEAMLWMSTNKDDYFFENIKKYLVDGILTDSTVVAGELFLEKYDLKVGDYLSFFVFKNNFVESAYKFQVSGSFKTNIPDYDSHLILSTYNLFDDEVEFEYFQINDFENTVSLDKINKKYLINDASEINSSFYQWLNSYDNPIKLLVFFIVVIALLNIINNNYYLLYYKKKQINILLSLGMNNASLKTIIVIRSSLYSIIGCLAAILLAYLFMYLQSNYYLIPLPGYVYFTEYLPVQVNFYYILFIFPFALTTAFLSSILNYNLVSYE